MLLVWEVWRMIPPSRRAALPVPDRGLRAWPGHREAELACPPLPSFSLTGMLTLQVKLFGARNLPEAPQNSKISCKISLAGQVLTASLSHELFPCSLRRYCTPKKPGLPCSLPLYTLAPPFSPSKSTPSVTSADLMNPNRRQSMSLSA